MDIKTTFTSLRHRNFRFYWTGQLVSLIGTWIQQVALSWLVLNLTDSAFLLGTVSAIGSAPILILSLPGGVAADRVSKKKLLITTQAIMMLLAFILAYLTHFKYLKIWHIILLSALSGSVFAFDAPARQAYTVELVGRKDLMNAIALNSTIFNTARILGPALAGVLYAMVGPAGCFLINGVSFLAVIYGLNLIRGEYQPRKGLKKTAWEEMKVGLGYVRHHPVIMSLVGMVAVFSIFGMPYAVLMPIFARDILHLQARGFGLLMTAVGIGAIIGAISLATFSQMKRRGVYVLVSGLVFTVAVTVFSLSDNLTLSIACLPFIGFTMVSQVATINTIIQGIAPDDIRGRVMSVFTFVFMGMMPVGSFIAGSIAGKFGAPAALQTGAAVCLATLVYLFWRNRELYWL
jgi:MFS family permease